jgi:hypothetical protein
MRVTGIALLLKVRLNRLMKEALEVRLNGLREDAFAPHALPLYIPPKAHPQVASQRFA